MVVRGGFLTDRDGEPEFLPFEWLELKRFGWSWITLKLLLLRAAQTRTFRRADGVVFLTSYARDIVMRVAKHTAGGSRTIPHGIDERFTHPPRAQLPAQAMDRPFRILYVSIIDVYKHQVEVVAAVAALRATGIPVELDLVGPAYPPALNRLERRLSRIDPGACLCVIHRRRKIRGTARSVRSR